MKKFYNLYGIPNSLSWRSSVLLLSKLPPTFLGDGRLGKAGCLQTRLLQPGSVHSSLSLPPDAENVVVLSQSKHFPIWEAHGVTSSF